MKFLKILALSVALLTSVQAVQQPSAHTKGTPTGKPTGRLKPGEYWWQPQLSPSGPLMVLVSVPRADDARLSQRHSHRSLNNKHRLKRARYTGRRLQHPREKAGALLEEIQQR